jgi:hypothetical protein
MAGTGMVVFATGAGLDCANAPCPTQRDASKANEATLLAKMK